MNRTKLKSYAPQARRDFIQAMTDRAAHFGLTAKKIEPVVQRGDVAVIAGREHPRAVAAKRKQLESRIKQNGFEQTMEAMAYTWFNRLVAIRFMELHGYLEHGYRVLSHPEGKPTPEILEHAEHVDLPGLKKETVIDLKLAGNKEGELYRLLLTAQCNALHTAMPFLFEKVEDETELLLSDNLLNSDSLIRKLVSEIDEDDWKEVEIIGWLYQFYISEKKDDVIGKVVASEDIPAATQLFTPNWIVKYLVQNTLGRQWLATYPQSALRQQMEYYIEPAEQTPEVQEQLGAITPTSLNPEELTLLDPACGSGHILVEAYDLFKAIYQERGYRAKDIPALILRKNLFGLEIDDRAAQLAAFALMMKARADDRRIFDSEAKPNIVAFQDSQGMNAADITHALNSPINKEDVPPSEYLIEEVEDAKAPLFSRKVMAEKGHVSQADIAALLKLFENSKTFGSLVQMPPTLAAKLPEIEKRLDDVLKVGDLTHRPMHVLMPLLQQARFLARQYDAVVANPPYMGAKYMSALLKQLIAEDYHDARSDLATAFVDVCVRLSSATGSAALVIPFIWMFNSTFQEFRASLLSNSTLRSLIQLEYNAFEPACVPVCCFAVSHMAFPDYAGDYIRLSEFKGSEQQAPKTKEAIQHPDCGWRFRASAQQFCALPGSPIVYWLPAGITALFSRWSRMSDFADAKVGLQTSNNARFVRYWHEVSLRKIGLESTQEGQRKCGKRWFPFNKGGSYRKWAGNIEDVVNWEDDGREIRNYVGDNGRLLSRPQNTESYFLSGITWSDITSSDNSFRWLPSGVVPSNVAHTAYFRDAMAAKYALAFVNSSIGARLANAISPTMHFSPGYFQQLPLPDVHDPEVCHCVETAIRIAQEDWDSHETAMNFQSLPIPLTGSLRDSYAQYKTVFDVEAAHLRKIETYLENHFRGLCGLEPARSADIRLTLRESSPEGVMRSLISFAIGCMMGRYSIDKPGLIYAHSGNQGFDPSQYKTFRADEDGIIPLLETDWGIRDDATNRLLEFVGVAWPKEHLEENLRYVADSLSPNNGEQPRETIRRYLATGFYKHHLSMYNKRPIYWLFSSGKQQAFQCLVYLHRYHEGTLARMRTEYVIPLQGQIAARIEQLEGDKAKATSTSHRKKVQKEQDDLKKQQTEMLTFEEKLKHAADQKINLDLDDGVKVNYGKFGDLLAEARSVTGGNEE